jgi:hypothetical protein
MTPHGEVYLWRGFRTIPGDSPPRKVDDCIYYRSKDGKEWSLHSKESPDHHWYIMSGSGMAELIDDHNLPSASSGSLAGYRSRGGNLDFDKPFKVI